MASGRSESENDSIYEFSAADYRNHRFVAKPAVYEVAIGADDALPAAVRATVPSRMRAIATDGGGSCAFHSVSDIPTHNGSSTRHTLGPKRRTF